MTQASSRIFHSYQLTSSCGSPRKETMWSITNSQISGKRRCDGRTPQVLTPEAGGRLVGYGEKYLTDSNGSSSMERWQPHNNIQKQRRYGRLWQQQRYCTPCCGRQVSGQTEQMSGSHKHRRKVHSRVTMWVQIQPWNLRYDVWRSATPREMEKTICCHVNGICRPL